MQLTKGFKTLKAFTAITTLTYGSFLLSGCGGDPAEAEWEDFYIYNSNHLMNSDVSVVDNSGNVIVSGDELSPQPTPSNYVKNLHVVKYSQEGHLLWSNSYDFSDAGERHDEKAEDMQIDINNNIYIAGRLYHPGHELGSYGSFLLKLDTNGELVWYRHIADLDPTFSSLSRDLELKNQLIYLAGNATKVFDLDGEEILSIDHGSNFVTNVDADNQGKIYSSGANFTSKHSPTGEEIWVIQNPENLGPLPDLALSQNDNSIITAHSNADGDTLLSKITTEGEVSWTRTITKPSSSAGAISGHPKLAVDNNDNVFVINSHADGRKLVKLSPSGNELWNKSNSAGIVTTLIASPDGGVYAYGASEGGKMDSQGNILLEIGKPNHSRYAGTSTGKGSMAVDGNNVFVTTTVYLKNPDEARIYTAKFVTQ